MLAGNCVRTKMLDRHATEQDPDFQNLGCIERIPNVPLSMKLHSDLHLESLSGILRFSFLFSLITLSLHSQRRIAHALLRSFGFLFRAQVFRFLLRASDNDSTGMDEKRDRILNFPIGSGTFQETRRN